MRSNDTSLWIADYAVSKVNDAVWKRRSPSSSKLRADVVGQCALAAAHDDQPEEQMALVDQPRPSADAHALPESHRLIHSPAVEVGADRPLESVDERMHLAIGLGPIEVPSFVLDVPVERGTSPPRGSSPAA